VPGREILTAENAENAEIILSHPASQRFAVASGLTPGLPPVRDAKRHMAGEKLPPIKICNKS